MQNETRKLLRLVVQSMLTGVTTAGTALLATAQSGPIEKGTIATAIIGGIVAAASTLNSGLSTPPGQTGQKNSPNGDN